LNREPFYKRSGVNSPPIRQIKQSIYLSVIFFSNKKDEHFTTNDLWQEQRHGPDVHQSNRETTFSALKEEESFKVSHKGKQRFTDVNNMYSQNES